MSSSKRAVWLVVLLILLATFVSAGGLLLIALLGGAPPGVPSNATLYVDLRPPYLEVEPSDLFSALADPAPTLRETVQMLEDARADDRVSGLIVTVQATGALWGQLQELRGAIAAVREAGKSVTAFMEFGGPGEYYVASAADRVVLMPGGSLDVAGLASYEVFLRGLLDKIGVYPDMLQIGAYKTAANTFTETSMTPAHREMAESMNADLFAELVSAVAVSREFSEEAARAALVGGPYTAEGAREAGLVDALAYRDQLDDDAPVRGTRKLEAGDYRRATEYRRPGRGAGTAGRVALLYAVGTIASGRSDAGGAVVGSDSFGEWLTDVRVDPSVRAVVVRIDSPGGSAIASEAIWREMMLTREVKPVIVSMGDVAASGGYYMAAPAHAIVAQPGTLTGSIGVVTGKFVVDGTLDKLGIGIEGVGEGERAGIYAPFEPFTPAERARVADQMRQTYDLFVSRVAEGRDRSAEQIDEVGQGRVWTGRQALERGLVDQLGGLDLALDLARERAKLDPEGALDLVVYPRKRSIYEIMANPLGTATELRSGSLFPRPELRALDTVASWLRLFRRGEPLALMPSLYVGVR